MAVFEVERRTSLSAPEAWARLTDWERHGDVIPFTTVQLMSPAPEASSETAGSDGSHRATGFVARTALGPLHFDDPMDVTYWQPPGEDEAGVCRIVKRGPVVNGWAVLTVTPTAGGSTVQWREDASFRFTGAVLGWPTRIVAAKVFGRLVDQLLGS